MDRINFNRILGMRLHLAGVCLALLSGQVRGCDFCRADADLAMLRAWRTPRQA